MKRKRRRKRQWLRRESAAASASLAFNLLPIWAELPDCDRYDALVRFIEGALMAYDDVPEPEFHPPEPSNN